MKTNLLYLEQDYINDNINMELIDFETSFFENTGEVSWKKRSITYNNLEWVNKDCLINSMINIIKKHPPKTLLDVGTGTGKILKAIKKYFPLANCWGIDISSEMLEKIEDKEDYILINNNAENMIDIPSNYFDVVTARMVFHHIKDMYKASKEVYRVLKSKGIFIICEGTPPNLQAIDWYTNMFKYKEKRHTLTEIDLINILLSSNFKNITTKTVILKNCSLNNWLENSGLPKSNIEIIKYLHYEAPEYIKKAYNMKFTDTDCYMDWKFAITYGIKI